MNKEEFKATLLKQVREQSPAIMLLMMKKNSKSTQRTMEYDDECYYRHEYYDVIVQFKLQSFGEKYPIYQVLFHDLNELLEHPEWDIKGELSYVEDLIRVIEEKLELEDNMLIFGHNILSVNQTSEGFYSLIKSDESLVVARYYLDDAETFTSVGQSINAGRSKAKNAPEYFLDLKLAEDEHSLLHEGLIKWAKESYLNQEAMREIDEFCDFCKTVKGNSDASCFSKLIKSLQSKPLPYKGREEYYKGVNITALTSELKGKKENRWI